METNIVNTATNAVSDIGMHVLDKFAHDFDSGLACVDQTAEWIKVNGLEFLANVIFAVLILFVGSFAIKLLEVIIARSIEKSKKVSVLLRHFITSVAVKVSWAFLIVTALGRLGVDIAPLVAGLGVTGFIVGFAFKDSLGNLASGLMIALNQPFAVGDYVQAGGQEGAVLELNMMATILATADNKKVILPNSVVWGGAVVNFSSLGKRRVDMQVGISYGSDVAKAIEVALETVKNIPGVLQDPVPVVAVASLDDSAVVLNVRPWASCADYWSVYSATQQSVKLAFAKAGIEIPFPQIDVHFDKPVA